MAATLDADCFNILVWDKQCEFSKDVLKYLQQLQFGIANCESLECLKNKRRALKILNCYDTRDLADKTADYNTISYSTMNNLLNS